MSGLGIKWGLALSRNAKQKTKTTQLENATWSTLYYQHRLVPGGHPYYPHHARIHSRILNRSPE